MQTEATVISIDGDIAVVENRRKSACDGCHNNKDGNGCSICSLTGGDTAVRLKAKNTAGAAVGDRVTVSTGTRRVLAYAWLVFLLPLITAGLGWWGGIALWQKEIYGIAAAVAAMALTFLGIWIYSKAAVSRRCDAEIIDIIENNINRT